MSQPAADLHRLRPHVQRTFVLWLTVACVSTSAAQDPEIDHFRTSEFVSAEIDRLTAFGANCSTFESESCQYGGEIVSAECETISLDTLSTADGTLYHLGRYRRSTTYAPDVNDQDPWTCDTDEVLLIRNTATDLGRPVWYGTSERTYEFIRDVELVNSRDGDVFSVMYCLNGTGGCYQRLFVKIDDGWRQVERDSTWQRVYDQLPSGYRPHKSPPMDLENLTWEHNVAGPLDANCCPSGRLHLELSLSGHLLSVRTARLEIDLNLSRE